MERHRNDSNPVRLNDDGSRVELLPVGPGDSSSQTDSAFAPGEQTYSQKPVIKGWPLTPKTLERKRWKHVGSLIVDLVVALLPLLFIGQSHAFHLTRLNQSVRSQC